MGKSLHVFGFQCSYLQNGIIIIKFNTLYCLFHFSDCQFPAGTRIYNSRELLSSYISKIM